MRRLNYEDLLYIDYKKNGSESAIEELIRETNGYLYSIVISFVFEQEIAEDLLDRFYADFFAMKETIDLSKCSIQYQMFSMFKKMLRESVYEEC